MAQPLSYLVYCRTGFEREAVAELGEACAELGLNGYGQAQPNSGYARFVLTDIDQRPFGLLHLLPWQKLIFARQLMLIIADLQLPEQDRVSEVVANLPGDLRLAEVRVEHSDSDPGRELAALCRGLQKPLEQALRDRRQLREGEGLTLHLLLTSGRSGMLGISHPLNASVHVNGIIRLRFPKQAPSRSTLKLDEAFLTLLNEQERQRYLKPGMSAVDLGAAPGGWSYQLVRRGITVTAIDNGAIDPALMASGMVEHLRVDGFTYEPRRRVDWLVCDMIDQPHRVAQRMAVWFSRHWADHLIFNLKLPMKKRRDEVQRCLALVEKAAVSSSLNCELRARQLYHDRDEVTVYLGRR